MNAKLKSCYSFIPPRLKTKLTEVLEKLKDTGSYLYLTFLIFCNDYHTF